MCASRWSWNNEYELSSKKSPKIKRSEIIIFKLFHKIATRQTLL